MSCLVLVCRIKFGFDVFCLFCFLFFVVWFDLEHQTEKQSVLNNPTNFTKLMLDIITKDINFLMKVFAGNGRSFNLALALLQKSDLNEFAEFSPDGSPSSLCNRNNKSNCAPNTINSLIISSTREAATNTKNIILDLGKYIQFHCQNLIGGIPIRFNEEKLLKGIDIASATVGRTWHLLQRNPNILATTQIVILDDYETLIGQPIGSNSWKQMMHIVRFVGCFDFLGDLCETSVVFNDIVYVQSL